VKWLVVASLAALAATGCDRTHLNPNFGLATRDAFRAQVIHPKAGEVVRPEQPLDPEEASIIARTYKRSLAPAGQQQDPGATRNQMLVVPMTTGAGMVPPPPPPGTGP
jgi:type IV pilus biogenesis protein CpaD/CtpE